MDTMKMAIDIMGLGMLGIFTAMVVIMTVTSILKALDTNRPSAP